MFQSLWIEYEGTTYHVASRGNARESIFWNDTNRVLDILGETRESVESIIDFNLLDDQHSNN